MILKADKKVIPDDFWTFQYYIDIAVFMFRNCKIKSSDGTSATGAKMTDCAQVNIKNCLFRGLDSGILLDGVRRNIIIDVCHLWSLTGSGIEICGNTNQGHELSEKIIEITGGSRNIKHTSIVGDYISSILPNGTLVIFVKCRNMTICATRSRMN